jgi:hypothetical protein
MASMFFEESFYELTAIQYDPLANPGRYISPDHHVFEDRFVRMPTAREDVDKLVEEKFDVYCNYMVHRAVTDRLRGMNYTNV